MPKIALPTIFGVVLLIVILAKSAITIGSGKAGVLFFFQAEDGIRDTNS